MIKRPTIEDSAPMHVNGDTVCSGEKCPCFFWDNWDCGRCFLVERLMVSESDRCIPGHIQRLEADLEKARREIWLRSQAGLDRPDMFQHKQTFEEYSKERGWKK